jgi:hypothetical protein
MPEKALITSGAPPRISRNVAFSSFVMPDQSAFIIELRCK